MTEVFRPLGDRVLVRPIKAKPREESRLDLGSSQEQEQLLRGEVVELPFHGVHASGLTVDVKLGCITSGSTIAYAMYSGKEIKLNGETLIILTEEEILGVFEQQA
jgi:chaperonin GroES